jgi:hypothetical protein
MFNRFVLFLFVFSVLVCAVPIDNETIFYLNSGETSSWANFSYGNASFYMIKINGQESVLLQESAGELYAVNDSSLSAAATNTYVRTQYLRQFGSTADSLNASLYALNASMEAVCLPGGRNFVLSPKYSPTSVLMNELRKQSTIYPTQISRARILMNATLVSLNRILSSMSGNITALKQGAAANDADAVYASAVSIYSLASRVLPTYANATLSVRNVVPLLPWTFFVDYVNYSCTLTTPISTNVNIILSQTQSVTAMNASELVPRVYNQTVSRLPSAMAKKSFYLKEVVYLNASIAANATSQAFYSIRKVQLKSLNSSVKDLGKLINDIRDAKTVSAVSSLSSQFDSKANQLNQLISSFNSVTDDYNATSIAMASCASAVAKAKERFGETNERVRSLRSRQIALETRMSAAENNLAAGRVPNATEFKSIIDEANSLRLAAQNLGVQANEIDLTTIAAVVITVAAIAGLFWYFKRMKGGGYGGKEIDIKDLNAPEPTAEEKKPVKKIALEKPPAPPEPPQEERRDVM